MYFLLQRNNLKILTRWLKFAQIARKLFILVRIHNISIVLSLLIHGSVHWYRVVQNYSYIVDLMYQYGRRTSPPNFQKVCSTLQSDALPERWLVGSAQLRHNFDIQPNKLIRLYSWIDFLKVRRIHSTNSSLILSFNVYVEVWPSLFSRP